MTNDKIAKALLDNKKKLILNSIKNEEKTVKQIANEIKVPSSRLYYHMSQLEELGLVTLVKTEFKGNMQQKYFKSTLPETQNLIFDGTLAKNNAQLIFNQIYDFFNDGIKALESELEKDPVPTAKDSDSETSTITMELTKEEWKALNNKIRDFISNFQSSKNSTPKKKYKYLIMTYLADN